MLAAPIMGHDGMFTPWRNKSLVYTVFVCTVLAYFLTVIITFEGRGRGEREGRLPIGPTIKLLLAGCMA